MCGIIIWRYPLSVFKDGADTFTKKKEEHDMKKLHLALCAAALSLSMGITAYAAPQTTEYSSVGTDLTLPDEMENTEGYFVLEEYGPVDEAHSTYLLSAIYFGMPKDEVESILFNADSTEEDVEKVRFQQSILGWLISTNADLETAKDAVENFFSDCNPQFDDAAKVGSAEGYTFYYVPEEQGDFASRLDASHAKEYQMLVDGLAEAFQSGSFYAPYDPDKNMAGKTIDFETTDVDGNKVNVKDLFADNKITMVNCWGLWCGACMSEMSDLAELHKKFREKGCGIVGLEWEKTEDLEAYQDSKKTLKDLGIEYPNVVLPKAFTENISGFPTSYFVDQDGKILTMPIVGAAVYQYEPTLDSLLNGEEVKEETENANAVSASYDVHVKDADGPLSGVMIQICDDKTCNFGPTGADGTAHFDLPGGVEYEVHVLVAPDGYAEDETVYHVSDESREVTIELKKQ